MGINTQIDEHNMQPKANTWLYYDGNSNICHICIINETVAIEMCVTLTWPLEWNKVKRKYANRKPIHDGDGNSIICPACHHLRDIHNKNVHDLELDL